MEKLGAPQWASPLHQNVHASLAGTTFLLKRFPAVGYGRYMIYLLDVLKMPGKCSKHISSNGGEKWKLNPMVERICKKSPTKQIQDLWGRCACVWASDKQQSLQHGSIANKWFSSRHPNRNCDAYESYQMVRWTHNTSGKAVTWGEGRFLSKFQFEGRLPELRYWTFFKI